MHRVSKDHLASTGKGDPLVLKELQVSVVKGDPLEVWEGKVKQDPLARPDPKGRLALLDPKVTLDRLDPKGSLVSQDRMQTQLRSVLVNRKWSKW